MAAGRVLERFAGGEDGLLDDAVAFHLILGALFLLAYPPSVNPQPRASPDASSGIRDRLTARDLLDGDFPEIVHNRYFRPIGATDPPAHRLSGLIHLSETTMVTSLPDSDWQSRGQTRFPEFSVRIINDGRHVIPLDRGILLSGEKAGSYWNSIVSPGRAWREPGDTGYSRASFPFTLRR